MQPTRIVKETCSQIKGIAITSLQGKWKIIILGMLMVTVLSYVPSMALSMIFGNSKQVGVVQFIYNLLIAGPLSFGFCSLCLHLLRGKPASPLEVLYGFEQFGKAFGVNCVISIISALFGGAIGFAVIGNVGGGYGILLALILVAVLIWVQLHFLLSYYILSDQPELGVFQILKESYRLTKGNKGKAFLLGLSFIGWFLLWAVFMAAALAISAILLYIVPIPLLILGAYMNQADAAFYELTRADSAIAIEETEKAKLLESL